MYANLKAVMAMKGVTIDAIATLLGVHRNTASNKIDGDTEFTYDQAQAIQETFFPEYNARYLFRRATSAEKTA